MKFLRFLPLILVCVGLNGCFGSGASSSDSAARMPVATGNTDVLRVGDKITIRLTGVPEDGGYIVEDQIPQNGEISVSYLTQPFQAVGKTAGDLAEEITQAYKSQRIYNTPVVTIIPEERFVSVGGDVRSPTRVIYTSDLTLMTAINSCGGFTDYARRNAVRIIRGSQVMYVDASAAVAGRVQDPPLFPGDQIYVQRTIF